MDDNFSGFTVFLPKTRLFPLAKACFKILTFVTTFVKYLHKAQTWTPFPCCETTYHMMYTCTCICRVLSFALGYAYVYLHVSHTKQLKTMQKIRGFIDVCAHLSLIMYTLILVYTVNNFLHMQVISKCLT